MCQYCSRYEANHEQPDRIDWIRTAKRTGQGSFVRLFKIGRRFQQIKQSYAVDLSLICLVHVFVLIRNIYSFSPRLNIQYS